MPPDPSIWDLLSGTRAPPEKFLPMPLKKERRQFNNLLADLVSSADLRQYRIDDNIITEKIKQFDPMLLSVYAIWKPNRKCRIK